MRRLFTAILIFTSLACLSQSFKEKELKSEIKEVTVFLSGAQIFETGTASLQEGKTILRVKNLPPSLDPKSIQVKGDGDFTILSVNHRLNHFAELSKDKSIDSLQQVIETIDVSVQVDNARLSVLKEKRSVLNANKSLGSESNGVSIAQLRQAIELYESETTKIEAEELKIRKSIDTKSKNKTRIEHELKELNSLELSPTSEIEIRVDSERALTAKFKISYLIANAGWYPKYDVRVKSIKNPLEITYKAEVFQNTGVDWKAVKLRFSNGDPNQSGLKPELTPWLLNLAQYTYYENTPHASMTPIQSVEGRVVDSSGNPLPGVNVVFKGTSVGTATNADGYYNLTIPNGTSTLVFSFIGYSSKEVAVTNAHMNVSLTEDVQQLNEVVTTGYGTASVRPGLRIRGMNSAKPSSIEIPTTFRENQTTVEIEVATPYTIKSGGERLLVDLKKYNVEALYQYYAIPKLDKDAFLVARIINWDQYNLLQGEANLYFEDAFVGKSVLDAKSLRDTLDISLGRDKNLLVGREKHEQFCKRKTIGGTMVETRAFRIISRNKKSQPLTITIFDQIPVSVTSDVTVSPIELSGGALDKKLGQIKWEVRLEPQEQKEILLQYEVKYPRREKVILE